VTRFHTFYLPAIGFTTYTVSFEVTATSTRTAVTTTYRTRTLYTQVTATLTGTSAISALATPIPGMCSSSDNRVFFSHRPVTFRRADNVCANAGLRLADLSTDKAVLQAAIASCSTDGNKYAWIDNSSLEVSVGCAAMSVNSGLISIPCDTLIPVLCVPPIIVGKPPVKVAALKAIKVVDGKGKEPLAQAKPLKPQSKPNDDHKDTKPLRLAHSKPILRTPAKPIITVSDAARKAAIAAHVAKNPSQSHILMEDAQTGKRRRKHRSMLVPKPQRPHEKPVNVLNRGGRNLEKPIRVNSDLDLLSKPIRVEGRVQREGRQKPNFVKN
jgi:hypothetical protein